MAGSPPFHTALVTEGTRCIRTVRNIEEHIDTGAGGDQQPMTETIDVFETPDFIDRVVPERWWNRDGRERNLDGGTYTMQGDFEDFDDEFDYLPDDEFEDETLDDLLDWDDEEL